MLCSFALLLALGLARIPLSSMIYLDNAASTPPTPEVLDAVGHAAAQHFANPSSAHGPGAASARALEEARVEVAALLRAPSHEIVFVSGGSEANALGVLGAAGLARGRHVVVSAIEHPSVLRQAERLAERGFAISKVAPGRDGIVRADALARELRPDTALVAVLLVSNELGTLQPVAELARAVRLVAPRAHFHVDAVQAAGLVSVDVRALGVDTVALSAHKMHGPKGVGALWIRGGARLAPLWDGGRQERGLRSGTENVPSCVGFARAVAQVRADREAPLRVASLRDELEASLFAAVPGTRPTVEGAPRAPHIASITLADLPAEPLLHALEARGVIVSAGSACASRTRGPSPVLQAIGVREQDAVLRVSLSRLTTREELPDVVNALTEAVNDVRAVTSSEGHIRRRRLA